MTPITVDLISDTATRPTAAMRRAMAEAPVGDEQLHEDPSVNQLVEEVCELLGQEAAIFLPSGTMCNQIALLTHCRPGDEVIAALNSHIHSSEGAGAAALAGALIYPIDAPRGIFDAAALNAAVRAPRQRSPRSRLVCIEQTSNRGGGAVWPLETVESVVGAAREHGLAAHMDGARLLNASVASGHPAAAYARLCDSAWLDFAKGLACPVGAVLAGSKAFIEDAWVWKHRLGGAMRQAGVLAAACLHALRHNVRRLAEDHAHARHFAELAANVRGVGVNAQDVETNIVFLDVSKTGRTAREIADALRLRGVRLHVDGAHRLRAVTHLDVNREQIEFAASALADALSAPRRAAS